MGGRGGSRSGGAGGGGTAVAEAPSAKPREFNAEERRALDEYIATSSYINGLLRGRLDPSYKYYKDVQDSIKSMDSAVIANGPLPKTMQLYRLAANNELQAALDAGQGKGFTFTDKGFVSTSHTGFHEYFRKNSAIEFYINAPAGTRAIHSPKFNSYEREIVLDRGTSFRVTDVKKYGNQWAVKVDVIQDKKK